jgi:nucleotide-binding universal stress UspA family protein
VSMGAEVSRARGQSQAKTSLPGPARFRRIVVEVGDGSQATQLETAVARVASGDAEVRLVHVSDRGGCCAAVDHPALHEPERELLSSMVARLSARGIRARSEQRATASGRVAEHLLDAAVECAADLLIVGPSEAGRLRGRSRRRVVQRVVRESTCPVLVLPRESTQALRPPRGRRA